MNPSDAGTPFANLLEATPAQPDASLDLRELPAQSILCVLKPAALKKCLFLGLCWKVWLDRGEPIEASP